MLLLKSGLLYAQVLFQTVSLYLQPHQNVLLVVVVINLQVENNGILL